MSGSTNGNANISQVAMCRMCDGEPDAQEPRIARSRAVGCIGGGAEVCNLPDRGRRESEEGSTSVRDGLEPPSSCSNRSHVDNKTVCRLMRIDANADHCWWRGQRLSVILGIAICLEGPTARPRPGPRARGYPVEAHTGQASLGLSLPADAALVRQRSPSARSRHRLAPVSRSIAAAWLALN
jgi:hypothetical protein